MPRRTVLEAQLFDLLEQVERESCARPVHPQVTGEVERLLRANQRTTRKTPLRRRASVRHQHPFLDHLDDELGVDTAGADQGDAVEGDATLEFSIANPGGTQMDVSFTNITNRTTKSAYNPIEWSNIQVRADGTFNKRNDMEKIHGIFYGPNHEEIGGTFNRDGVTGAYGAKR